MKNKYSLFISLLWCMGATCPAHAMQQDDWNIGTHDDWNTGIYDCKLAVATPLDPEAAGYQEDLRIFREIPLLGFESENDLFFLCVKLRALEKCPPNDLPQLALGQAFVADHFNKIGRNIESSLKNPTLIEMNAALKLCAILDSLKRPASKNFINLLHNQEHHKNPMSRSIIDNSIDPHIKNFLTKVPRDLNSFCSQLIDQFERLFVAGALVDTLFASEPIVKATPSQDKKFDGALTKLSPFLAKKRYFTQSLSELKTPAIEYIAAPYTPNNNHSLQDLTTLPANL